MATIVAEHAVVDPRAIIDDDVEIGPFCVVGPQVTIGRGTRLVNNVTITGHVTIGQHNRFHPGVVIGGEPQDLSYRGSPTQVVIGDHNVFRECVTVNRATEKEDGVTRVGDHGFFMACSHIAHDCQVGDHVVMANGVLLGGHVHVAHHVTIAGGERGASFRHDWRLRICHGHEPRDSRRAAVHVARRAARASAVHQRRGAQAQ